MRRRKRGNGDTNPESRSGRTEVDPDDERILNALLADARQSYRHIAAGLGLATATVAQRVRNLERRKILLGVVPILNFEKLGFAFCVITQVKIHQGKLSVALRRIAANPHVFGIYDHTGGTDATVLARFRDRQSLDRFLKQIQAAPHVERTETQLVLNIFKEFIRHLPVPMKGRKPAATKN